MTDKDSALQREVDLEAADRPLNPGPWHTPGAGAAATPLVQRRHWCSGRVELYLQSVYSTGGARDVGGARRSSRRVQKRRLAGSPSIARVSERMDRPTLARALAMLPVTVPVAGQCDSQSVGHLVAVAAPAPSSPAATDFGLVDPSTRWHLTVLQPPSGPSMDMSEPEQLNLITHFMASFSIIFEVFSSETADSVSSSPSNVWSPLAAANVSSPPVFSINVPSSAVVSTQPALPTSVPESCLRDYFHLPLATKEKIWRGKFIDILSLLPLAKDFTIRSDRKHEDKSE